MSNRISYTVTNESITVIHNGNPVTVKKTAANFVPLRSALIEERWADAVDNLTVGASLFKWAKGRFSVTDNIVHFDGAPIPSELNGRIVEIASTGGDPQVLFNFWERLQRNPSKNSVDQLWRFLDLVGIPLTSDGCFLAYKGVRNDFKDCYTGTIDNSPGKIIRIARNKVSDDPNHACHAGLHAGSLEYASNHGPLVVIVKIDPEHVVSVPHDCSSQKMRVCEYEVVGLHGSGHMPSTFIDDSEWSDYDEFDDVSDHEYDGSDASVPPVVADKTPDKTPKWMKKLRDLNKCGSLELQETNMDVLRAYATKVLRIVNASRIPGGKSGLVDAIMKARK